MGSHVTYYQILGVSNLASIEDIRAKYRTIAKIYHPDKGGDAKAFQLVNEAFQTLSNPVKRKLYDEELKASKSSNMSEESVISKVSEVEEESTFNFFKFFLYLLFYFVFFWVCTEGAEALGVPTLGYFVYIFVVYWNILKS